MVTRVQGLTANNSFYETKLNTLKQANVWLLDPSAPLDYYLLKIKFGIY